MADDSLPSEYDAIVLGTGITESIIAAALSRIGQRVLHLDRNDCYSGDWGTFHFEAMQKWIARQQGQDKEPLTVKPPVVNLLKEGEVQIRLRVESQTVSNVVEQVLIAEEPASASTAKMEKPSARQLADRTGGGDVSDEAVVGASKETVAGISEVSKETKAGDTEVSKKTRTGDREVAKETNAGDTEVSKETKKGEVSKETTVGVSEVSTETKASDSDVSKETRTGDTEISKETKAGHSEVSNVTRTGDIGVCKETKAGDTEVSKETADDGAISKEEAVSAEPSEPALKKWCFSEMKKLWRKFNIDLQPKVFYCRGPMVELLISSDIAKYCEFKSITRVLTLLGGELQKVPCSRADVFSSKQVSMIEKRMLMKLLTFCMEYDKHPQEYQGFEDKTFDEFLATRKLTSNIRHYVRTSIAMATSQTTTMEGLQSTQKFLQSLGRYGNTAFLWPLYGSGELPQCFCRMCAVFGGIYCLRRTGVSLIVDQDNKCKGIIDSEGQRLEAKWIILESSYAAEEMLPKEKPKSISRAIFVTDRSLLGPDGEHISLLTLPAGDGQENLVNVIELSPTSMACPKDTHMVHMTCAGTKGPQEDFAAATGTLFQPLDPEAQEEGDTRPKVLWSVSFSQENTTALNLNGHGLQGVHVVATPDGQLDFDNSIKEALGVFEVLCPGEEFLPRAPNPEDIIYDYDQQGPKPEGSGFESATDTTTEDTAIDSATTEGTAAEGTAAEGTAAGGTAAGGTTAEDKTAEGTIVKARAVGTAVESIATGGTTAEGIAGEGTIVKATDESTTPLGATPTENDAKGGNFEVGKILIKAKLEELKSDDSPEELGIKDAFIAES